MKLPGLSIGGTIVATALVTSLVNDPPAYATSALARIESAAGCATSSACVSGSNTTSGPGVSGTSAKGYGVEGVSTSNDGLKGISTSSNGLSASSTSSFGVKGESSTSYGVWAYSTSGGGMLGQTAATKTKNAGVMGVDVSTNGGTNDGVFGSTTNGGWGVEGQRIDGGSTGGGVKGTASQGIGVEGDSGDIGVSGDGSVVGVNGQSGIYPFVGQDQNGDNVFFVLSNGTVTTNGEFRSLATQADGRAIQSFGTKTTRPTVEDTGTARLSGGAAAVTLDPLFARTIETSSAYRVFVTPGGDTRGLYVTSKSPRGFIVREAQGGRSSVDFDYRIVAIAAGSTGERMTLVDRSSLPHAPRNAKGIKLP